MSREPNWALITDLALKAADDARDAIGRTVILAENPMEATLVSLVAFAILKGEHEGVKEAMAGSPVIANAAKIAEDVAEAVKGRRREQLRRTMPRVREVLRLLRERGITVG